MTVSPHIAQAAASTRSEAEVRALRCGHTGGPWQQKHDFDREGMLSIVGNVDGEYIDGVAHCTYTTICEVDDNADGLANARLIAAAPEILAVLQRLCALNARGATIARTWGDAEAIIAKATGAP